MANAKKCDRCGKLFEPYNYNIDEGYKVPSMYTSILVKNISLAKEEYKEYGDYDLCKECNDSFLKWLSGTNDAKHECGEETKENENVKQKGCNVFGAFDGSINCLMCIQCDECREVTNSIKEASSNGE